MDTFTNWYNHEHRHRTTHARRRAFRVGRRQRAPKILDLPDTARINRPTEDTIQETDTTTAQHPMDSSTLM
jgi:hypothetical protein